MQQGNVRHPYIELKKPITSKMKQPRHPQEPRVASAARAKEQGPDGTMQEQSITQTIKQVVLEHLLTEILAAKKSYANGTQRASRRIAPVRSSAVKRSKPGLGNRRVVSTKPQKPGAPMKARTQAFRSLRNAASEALKKVKSRIQGIAHSDKQSRSISRIN
jgi:hypothetical protein